MEITTRRPPHRWRRVGVALGSLAVVLAVGLLVPATLGLSPHPLADSALAGPYERGELLFQEDVQRPGELSPGDVITFAAPNGAAKGTAVTRKVVEVDGATARTRAARAGAAWRVSPHGDDVRRVVFAVPFAGHPQLLWSWLTWPVIAALLATLAAAALLWSRRVTSRRRRPHHVTTEPAPEPTTTPVAPTPTVEPMAGRAASGF